VAERPTDAGGRASGPATSDEEVGVPTGLRVGVLSPFVGGDYYGAIIAGLNAAATAQGGRVLALQTLDPGAHGADYCGVPDVRLQVAWSHFDAGVVLPGAVDARCVRQLQHGGKPVVLVGHTLRDAQCPTVRVDNRAGVRASVEHLVEHGHRRIAFAGQLAGSDVHERYEGYLEALHLFGLGTEAELLVTLPDNHETGGVVAAEALLAMAGDGTLPVTAVVLGTDRNAIGLVRRLTEAGLHVPADLAVIGFDDLAEARYAEPSLASVHQPLHVLGATAYQALSDGGAGTRLVPTRFVARDSCGCGPTGLELSPAQARSQFEDNTLLQLTLNIQYELGSELLRTHERDPRGMAWLGRTPARAGCLGLWPRDPDDEADGTDADDAATAAPVDADPLLEIVGAFRADGSSSPAVGRVVPVSQFPSPELFTCADGARDEIVFVVPVRTASRDWGMLAAVGRIQDSTPPGRETMNHSAALLALALDHDTVLRSLHEQKERLRRAALYDQLTGLPNRTLLEDRLRRAGHRAARRPSWRFALLFLDLDGFKQVNDELGHAIGDRVLIEVARRLGRTLRRTDTAARLGGDEFVVLLDGLGDLEEARLTAERIRVALAEPLDVDGTSVTIGVSIGIAGSDAQTLDPDELLRRADAEMYRAKSSHRERAAGAATG
jgi:diguanylate cyclase (GGDEF)-like protein